MASKKLQQINDELYANAKPFSKVYPNFDIRQLPSWLQEQRLNWTSKENM